MELNKIVDMQVAQDEANGFPIRFNDATSRYNQITKDLVGLFGEIGEFSNIIKKINIKLERPDEYELNFPCAEASLREELVDSLIYIIRLGAMLDIDIEKELLGKMQVNAERYAKMRRG